MANRGNGTTSDVQQRASREAAAAEAEAVGVRKRNIEAMAGMEAEERRKRTRGECVGDSIAAAASKLWFLTAHAIWFAVWIGLNSGLVPRLKPFDPYPFSFLTFVVSLEAIFLSLFILMSQGREMRQADQRAKLDLQINLLAETETTKLIQMVRALCIAQKLDVADDPELAELVERTSPEGLMQEVIEACEVTDASAKAEETLAKADEKLAKAEEKLAKAEGK